MGRQAVARTATMHPAAGLMFPLSGLDSLLSLPLWACLSKGNKFLLPLIKLLFMQYWFFVTHK